MRTIWLTLCMERHILSKSTFLRGIQCTKSLYLYKKHYYLRDKLSAEQRAIFSRGTNVGVLARDLFPGGVDASPKTPFQFPQSVAFTRELIKKGTPVIYEAAFQHNGVLAAMDIIVKEPDGWIAYEVKSSRQISETYLLDAALQYYVIQGSGLPLKDIVLVTINGAYQRDHALDIHKLFNRQSVFNEALKQQTYIQEQLPRLMETTRLDHAPEVPIGIQCHTPYPCDFMGHCHKNVPAQSVLHLVDADHLDRYNYYHSNTTLLSELPDDNLTPGQLLQATSHRTQKATIRHAALSDWHNQWSEEAVIVHLLRTRPAVPRFQNTTPYQTLPFGLVCKPYKSGARAKSWLASPTTYHPTQIIEPMKKLLADYSQIMVWDMKAWQESIATLMAMSPEETEWLETLLKKSIDIAIPWKQQLIYHPAVMENINPIMMADALGCDREYQGSITSGRVAGSEFLHMIDHPEAGDKKTHSIKRYALRVLKNLGDLLNVVNDQISI